MSVILWTLGAFLAWLALALGAAVVVGRAITTADQRCCPHDDLDDELVRLADGGIYL